MEKLTKLQIKNIEDVLEATYHKNKLNKNLLKENKYRFTFKEKCHIGIELREKEHSHWPEIIYYIWTDGEEYGYEFKTNDLVAIGDIING